LDQPLIPPPLIVGEVKGGALLVQLWSRTKAGGALILLLKRKPMEEGAFLAIINCRAKVRSAYLHLMVGKTMVERDDGNLFPNHRE
jgi:hypothetical protein